MEPSSHEMQVEPLKFRALHQVKNHKQLRYLLMAKEVQSGWWKKVVISASDDQLQKRGLHLS